MTARPLEPRFLDRALELAERGRYGVSPNPMVGAVVVRAGRVVGEGYHRRAGGPHAEALALSQAGRLARGGDLYVTLEPCNHSGRTPPCTDAILRAGIARVLFALPDPNPLVAGGGAAALSRAGVAARRADAGRARLAARQNEKFLVRASKGRPFVLAKWASTLDGRLADLGGASRWITGEAARRRALLLREEYDAVLVGAQSVLTDDPRLTRRLGKALDRPHWRIVLDGRLRLPERARLLRRPRGVVVVTARPVDSPKARRLAARGIELWRLRGSPAGRVSIPELLERLAQRGVTSLMVEGGAGTHWSFFSAGVVDRVCAFVAPNLLGGVRAPAAVGGEGFRLPAAVRLEDVEVERVGSDLMISGRVAARRRRAGRRR
ncbi:MAG: bifunctional diaminohydroxyphosphoribosylaminopyrimidine deaminase/5-amino-6-(5-phosphoribosylamino)uracil reductase RibD [Acidobacteriota bacterium]